MCRSDVYNFRERESETERQSERTVEKGVMGGGEDIFLRGGGGRRGPLRG